MTRPTVIEIELGDAERWLIAPPDNVPVSPSGDNSIEAFLWGVAATAALWAVTLIAYAIMWR